MLQSKLLRSAMALAALLSLSLPLASYAEVITQDIILDKTNRMTVAMPQVRLSAGDTLWFHVVNPNDQPLNLAFEGQDINIYIPANSDQTFPVDITKLSNLDQGIRYSVYDFSGTRLAAGAVSSEGAPTVAVAGTPQTSTPINTLAVQDNGVTPVPQQSTAASSTTTTTQQTVYTADYSVPGWLASKYSLEQKPEPSYRESNVQQTATTTPAQSGFESTATVRGYW
jgi:hypothetical protein